MKLQRRIALAFCIALFIQPWFARAEDAAGCKDSPLISRYPGSVLEMCEHRDDDSYTFTTANKQKKAIEGDFTHIEYRFPKGVTTAPVLRNLVNALHSAGYIFEQNPTLSQPDFNVHKNGTWMSIQFFGNGDGFKVFIVKEIALTQVMVATAADLSSGIGSSGHSVINGILFDTGKADVKPESAPALKAVADLLAQDPKLKVYVVGHTDNVGALAANMDLSKRRAAAVVQALSAAPYSVAASRMQSFGDGPTAPVASNDSEDGRASNRRVELVKQ
ncbi:MAG: OmpA family protein [Acidobacteriaceae bacterium]|nr:OmpA family protein [Acidobacteriaceae bacterium]